jgi:hypothetical protein
MRISTSFLRRIVLLGSAAALLSFAFLAVSGQEGEKGKDEPATPVSQTFVGPLEGGPASARIAVVTEKDKFLVYSCSQDVAFNGMCSRWLRGTIGDKGTIEATSPDGVKVAGEIKGNTIEGTLTAKDKTMKFTAKKVTACQNAGLYRAVDSADGEEFVAGWIVDEADAIAGNVQNQKKKINQLPPKNDGNNLGGILNPKGKNNVNAQKVNSATNPGNGTVGRNPLGKIDPETRAEILQDLVGRFQKKKTGSPLQGIFVNVLRRSLAGAKAADADDAKLLAIAKKINPKTIKSYISLWDALPVATRSTLLGADNVKVASGQTPLTKKALAGIVSQLTDRPSTKGGAKQPTGVKSVQIRQLVCVDETNPEFAGSDEIFIIYTVIQGETVFTPQKTTIYTGLDTGKTAQLTGADVTVFPPPGQKAGLGDIEIAASIFEDDSIDNAFVAELVKGATDIAVEALKAAGKDGAVDLTKALGDFFDTLIGGLPTTQFLGSDAIVVRANGQLTSINGQSKTTLAVQRNNGITGNRVFRYELRNIQVTKN